MELSETDKDGYKSAIENFIDSAQTFIEDNHYEATVALKLLTGNKAEHFRNRQLLRQYETADRGP